MKKHERIILGLVLAQLVVLPCIYRVRAHAKVAPEIAMPKLVKLTPSSLIGDEDELRGAIDAEYTLVEFGDYQCPPCAHSQSLVTAMLDDYPSKLRFRFHHFPLKMHEYSSSCALISEESRLVGQFWKVHDGMYALNTRVSPADIANMLRNLNVDEAHLSNAQIASARKRVDEDVMLAKASNVEGTPTFFLCVPGGRVYKLGDISQVDMYVQ